MTIINRKKPSDLKVLEIMALADDMAASMTSLNPHNYSIFIDSREKLKEKIQKICDEYDEAA